VFFLIFLRSWAQGIGIVIGTILLFVNFQVGSVVANKLLSLVSQRHVLVKKLYHSFSYS